MGYSAPYDNWKISKTDSRGDFTQNESYTRDQLLRQDFALETNRVNRGPYENTRRYNATTSEQMPQYYGNTDRYGWNDWVRRTKSDSSNLAQGLNESYQDPTPGSEYQSQYFSRRGTAPGGCSSCRRPRRF